MFIPEWALWAFGIFAVFHIAGKLDGGNYDFVTPLLAAGVVFIAVAFRIGIWLGG